MTTTWKTVSIFISSTFRDMHAERDHLVKVVFPALRERLEPYRVHLIDVDLRWGVTREQAENDKVLDVCLHYIDECRPFFVGLLGQRYGWVPNRIPADTASRYGLLRTYQQKSVTEFEVLYGVLHNPQMRGHAFFYFRDSAALNDVPPDMRDAVYADTDLRFIAKLDDLKQRIRDSGYPVMDGYPARWDPEAYDRPTKSHGRLVGLDAFGERVRNELWTAIKAELQLPDTPPTAATADPLAEEADYHQRFIESRLRVYVGREEIHQQLLDYVNGTDTKPLLLTGPSGSGKSAVIARLASSLQQSAVSDLRVVIAHLVGASPASTSIRQTLRRFCLMLEQALHEVLEREKTARLAEITDSDQAALEKRRAIEKDYEVPQETSELIKTFRDFIAKVPADQRTVLVIDAINQFDEADHAHELAWLPRTLPSNVKVVLSCIDEAGRDQPVLDRARQLGVIEQQVTPLTDADRREIIRQVPSLSAKALDDHQADLLLHNPATTNPLFLLVALEELRGFGSYEQLTERIAAFPREGDCVTSIFTQVIERLEEEFRKETVRSILALLASARRGLSERELQELTLSHPEPADGAGDNLFPILRQIRPYLLSRGGLIDFYHRTLFKAVFERYLFSSEKQVAAHARLAEYFYAQDYFIESLEEQRQRARTAPPTPRPVNLRKVDELAWQRLRAEQWDQLEQLLIDLSFLEAKTEAGMVFELAVDFTQAQRTMPADLPQQRILQLLEEAIRTDINFIARHPMALFQCLWNSCWWYDCPAAARHYEVPAGQSAATPAPWEQPGRKLYELAEKWRSAKEAATPSFYWLRSRRPPPVHLGTSQRAVLRGHEGTVRSVALSGDGRRIVSGSEDRTVRVWDGETGAELRCLRGHQDWVWSVALSADGCRIVSGSRDRTVRLWDAASGEELRCLRGHEEWVTSVALSADGRRIASGSFDGTVRLWDAASGEELHCLRGHQNRVEDVALSADGRRIVSGSEDRTVRVWDAASGQELRCLHGHENPVSSVALRTDGTRIVSGSWDETVRVWDAETGAELRCLHGHEDGVLTVALSGDGRRIVSGSEDRTVRVWNTASGRELRCLRGHINYVTSVALSADGRRIVSGSRDRTVRVWDAGTGAELRYPCGHDGLVTSVALSGDGRRIVSGSDDRTVRIWDAETGAELHCLRGHEDQVKSVALSADGRRIVSGSDDRTVRVWDAETGAELHCLRGHESSMKSVALSADGRRIVSNSDDLTVRVWDAETGAELCCLRGHAENWVTSVALSADGRRIVSGSDDGTVRVWDAETGAELHCLRGHEKWVQDVALSADGRRIVSASDDGTMRVWDAASGQELRCLHGHESWVTSVALSADGRRVVSGHYYDRTVRVWDAETGACLEAMKGPYYEDGTGIAAIAEGTQTFPFRAWPVTIETAVEDARTGEPVAWFPVGFDRIRTLPGSRAWAGASGNHLYIITLEGRDADHSSKPVAST